MIRTFRHVALLLTAPAALGLGLAASGPAAAAVVHPAAGCTGASADPIAINGFAFAPAQVAPGGSATADLITTNCAATSVASTEEWSGQWLPLATSGAAPAGCPVIDPLLRSVTYAPGQELAENTSYTVPVGCQAAELAVTVTISVNAGAETQATTAYLVIERVSPGS